MPAHRSSDLPRQLLSILALLALIAAGVWVLRPFIAPLIWATMIVVSTWPLMVRLEARLKGRRTLAVGLMLVALLLLFFVPITAALVTLVDHADEAVEWVRSLPLDKLAAPPEWVGELPVVGVRLAQLWRESAEAGASALLAKLSPYAGSMARNILSEAGALGMIGLQFLMTMLICGVLYAHAESAADLCRRFARRLAGPRGVEMVQLAAMSVRGVALGVVITAVAQALLAGLGLLVAGVPGVSLLTTIMFVLTIAQIGPFPVLLLACGWLFWKGHTGWAIALFIWSLLVGTMDNVLRPWLIRKGADLPLLLIFTGVVGGLIAFGLIGIFLGPVVLAITYTLMGAWVDEVPDEDNPA